MERLGFAILLTEFLFCLGDKRLDHEFVLSLLPVLVSQQIQDTLGLFLAANEQNEVLEFEFIKLTHLLSFKMLK